MKKIVFSLVMLILFPLFLVGIFIYLAHIPYEITNISCYQTTEKDDTYSLVLSVSNEKFKIILNKDEEFSNTDIENCKKYYLKVFNSLKDNKPYTTDHPYSRSVNLEVGRF